MKTIYQRAALFIHLYFHQYVNIYTYTHKHMHTYIHTYIHIYSAHYGGDQRGGNTRALPSSERGGNGVNTGAQMLLGPDNMPMLDQPMQASFVDWLNPSNLIGHLT